MKKMELKNYDIESYDIELEYNEKISPIESKIQKLTKNHEVKSLKAHKNFLEMDKLAKATLSTLSEKAAIKYEKIEKTEENKLTKLKAKDKKLKKDFEDFITRNSNVFKVKIQEIEEIKKETELLKKHDIETIKLRYDQNLTSYVEKLDTYNKNFNNNKIIHEDQIIGYNELLNLKLKEIADVKERINNEIQIKQSNFIEEKAKESNSTKNTFDMFEKELNGEISHIKSESKLKIKDISSLIIDLKNDFVIREGKFINDIEENIYSLSSEFLERKDLIERDLQMNIDKLNVEPAEGAEKQTSKVKRAIKMKIDLFNSRASTIIGFEELLLNERIALLKEQIITVKNSSNNEQIALDKVELFLNNDQLELKNIGDYFKTINLTLKKELNNFELANNEYLINNEKTKADFLKMYSNIFYDFKRILLDTNKSSIDQLTIMNFEIDELNKLLDTAGPLKEIKVNRLREIIEINEIEERYNIKFAKLNHEIKVIENELKDLIQLEDCKMNNMVSENIKEIEHVKAKKIQDIATEKVILKFSNANEIYKLRLNSTKIERSLLDDQYAGKLEILYLENEIAILEVDKKNIFVSIDVEKEINSIFLERDYKVEVVNKRLEEDLLKFDEQINKLKFESDAFSVSMDNEISVETLEIEKVKDVIHTEIDKKIALINEALEREIREPSSNIHKVKEIINEGLSNLDLNDERYQNYSNETIKMISDKDLAIIPFLSVALNSESLISKSVKHINNGHEILETSSYNLFDSEIKSLKNKISSNVDPNSIKKINKLLQKANLDFNKQKSIIASSKIESENLFMSHFKSGLSTLQKNKTDDVDMIREQVLSLYISSFDFLKTLRADMDSKLDDLLKSFIKYDQVKIEDVNINSRKAVEIVEREREMKILPYDTNLANYIKAKNAMRAEKNSMINEKISELKSEMIKLNDESSAEVADIRETYKTLVDFKKNHLNVIRENEKSNIYEHGESISNKKNDLEILFNESIQRLEEKDFEAKKVFDFEERIHDIAVETATFRFIDAVNNADNTHLTNTTDATQKAADVLKNTEIYLKTISKELLDEISKYEKLIFTTRPRLEESIDEAQKAIEKENKINEIRLNALIENKQIIVKSLEKHLVTSFEENFDKMISNLNNYLSTYKLIGDEYSTSINNSNNVIYENNISFTNALFEHGNIKHQSNIEKTNNLDNEIV